MLINLFSITDDLNLVVLSMKKRQKRSSKKFKKWSGKKTKISQ